MTCTLCNCCIRYRNLDIHLTSQTSSSNGSHIYPCCNTADRLGRCRCAVDSRGHRWPMITHAAVRTVCFRHQLASMTKGARAILLALVLHSRTVTVALKATRTCVIVFHMSWWWHQTRLPGQHHVLSLCITTLSICITVYDKVVQTTALWAWIRAYS